MSGFRDINGASVMAGSPPLEIIAEHEIQRHDECLSGLREVASLNISDPLVHRAKRALALCEAGDWEYAMVAYLGRNEYLLREFKRFMETGEVPPRLR
jgi:hypothetical protein